MIDPLAEVVTLLQPQAPFSKLSSGAGRWSVRRVHEADSGGLASAVGAHRAGPLRLLVSPFRTRTSVPRPDRPPADGSDGT